MKEYLSDLIKTESNSKDILSRSDAHENSFGTYNPIGGTPHNMTVVQDDYTSGTQGSA